MFSLAGGAQAFSAHGISFSHDVVSETRRINREADPPQTALQRQAQHSGQRKRMKSESEKQSGFGGIKAGFPNKGEWLFLC